ncbi:hypothetical protein SCHPADRAFT_930333 [Schizopora paradoxa]|uniref:Uncharacterized protein n=1 Tax=Schizopora paradoxa TaxID=27342 RepID=A0A0H2S190_9AGAM|nr:hypothetical protein SCHPADRAFT_930333 [Schizopora paradoxa]
METTVCTSNLTRKGVPSVRLKGVGAKLRNEWYQTLVEEGSAAVIRKDKKEEILKKIHQTDPWYGIETLTYWIASQRSRAKKKAALAEQRFLNDSQGVPIKLEETQQSLACPVGISNPVAEDIGDVADPLRTYFEENSEAVIDVFHAILDSTPLGDDKVLQELAAGCHVDVKILEQYRASRLSNILKTVDLDSQDAVVRENVPHSAFVPASENDSPHENQPWNQCKIRKSDLPIRKLTTLSVELHDRKASASTSRLPEPSLTLEYTPDETPLKAALSQESSTKFDESSPSISSSLRDQIPRPAPRTLEEFCERFQSFELQIDSILNSM